MIFGVGEGRRVFWYHPDWTEGSDDSSALPISNGELVHELSDTIEQTLQEGRLQVFALFTSREDLRVSEVQAAVAAATPGPGLGMLALPGCEVRSVLLHVKESRQ
jgi:hypothetical protein